MRPGGPWPGTSVVVVRESIDNLQARLSETAADGGGTVSVRASASAPYELDAPLTVPDGVGLRGEGTLATVFRCTTPDARIAVQDASNVGRGNRGPGIGGFSIDGADIATNPLYLGYAVQRELRDIEVANAAQDNIVFEYGQNLWMYGIQSHRAGRHCVVFDRGAGGHRIYGFEFEEPGQVAGSGGFGVAFRQSGPSENVYGRPTDVTLDGGIIERLGGPGAAGAVYVGAGEDLQFNNVALSNSSPNALPLILAEVMPGAGYTQRIHFRAGFFFGDTLRANTTLLRGNGSTRVHFDSACSAQNMHRLYYLADSDLVDDDGMNQVNVGTIFANNGGTEGYSTLVRTRLRNTIEVTTLESWDPAIDMLRAGQHAAGLRLRPAGVEFGDGASNPDVLLFRREDSAGRAQLCVRFGNSPPQVIATEA